MQSGGVLFLVVSLDGQTARPLEIVDAALRITVHDFDSPSASKASADLGSR